MNRIFENCPSWPDSLRSEADATDRIALISKRACNFGAGNRHVVVSAAGRVDLYDVKTGRTERQFEGRKGNTVPSATLLEDKILVGSSDVSSNLALILNADDALEPQFAISRASCTFSSPLCYLGRIYSVNRAGVAFCNDATTGELQWSKRIGSSCWASHVGVANRVYFFGKDGTTTVVQVGSDFESLAKNKLTLKESTKVYGVAIVQGRLVIRTGNELICIGKSGLSGKADDVSK